MREKFRILFPLKMKPETELLQRCKKDDRKAHHELYSMCFQFLYGICRRYYVNQEDRMSALNLAFVKIIKNIHSYIQKEKNIPFELWIRRITINHIVDEFRRNKSYRELQDLRDFQEVEFLHPQYDPALEKAKLEEILFAIDKLPAMNRAVFNLFVLDGYKHEEIAAMLKISANTSKVHLHRAKKKLQEFLESEWKKKHVTSNFMIQ